jgi:hypothetical protein
MNALKISFPLLQTLEHYYVESTEYEVLHCGVLLQNAECAVMMCYLFRYCTYSEVMGGCVFVADSWSGNRIARHLMDNGAPSNEVTCLSLCVLLKLKKCNTALVCQPDETHFSD